MLYGKILSQKTKAKQRIVYFEDELGVKNCARTEYSGGRGRQSLEFEASSGAARGT